jgi:hypothetical protein
VKKIEVVEETAAPSGGRDHLGVKIGEKGRPPMLYFVFLKRAVFAGPGIVLPLRACEFNGQTPCLIPENTGDYLVRRLD